MTEFQICWTLCNTPSGKSEQHLFEFAKLWQRFHIVICNLYEYYKLFLSSSSSSAFDWNTEKGLAHICDFNSLIGRKTLLDPSTLFKSTVLDTRRQCQEIIKQNDLPQCDRGTPLTFSLPCPLNIKPATAL